MLSSKFKTSKIPVSKSRLAEKKLEPNHHSKVLENSESKCSPTEKPKNETKEETETEQRTVDETFNRILELKQQLKLNEQRKQPLTIIPTYNTNDMIFKNENEETFAISKTINNNLEKEKELEELDLNISALNQKWNTFINTDVSLTSHKPKSFNSISNFCKPNAEQVIEPISIEEEDDDEVEETEFILQKQYNSVTEKEIEEEDLDYETVLRNIRNRFLQKQTNTEEQLAIQSFKKKYYPPVFPESLVTVNEVDRQELVLKLLKENEEQTQKSQEVKEMKEEQQREVKEEVLSEFQVPVKETILPQDETIKQQIIKPESVKKPETKAESIVTKKEAKESLEPAADIISIAQKERIEEPVQILETKEHLEPVNETDLLQKETKKEKSAYEEKIINPVTNSEQITIIDKISNRPTPPFRIHKGIQEAAKHDPILQHLLMTLNDINDKIKYLNIRIQQ